MRPGLATVPEGDAAAAFRTIPAHSAGSERQCRDLSERPAGRACVHVRRPPRIGLRSETRNLGVMP